MMAKTSQAQLKAAEKYLSGQRQIVIRIDRTTEEGLLRWFKQQLRRRQAEVRLASGHLM